MWGRRRGRSGGLCIASVLAAMLVAAGCGDGGTPQRKLVFAVQPTDAEAGVAIAPAVVVEIRDESGGVDAAATDNVSLAVTGGGAPLVGTATRAAVAGVATFNDISIQVMGTGYTLDATAVDITSATSDSFNVTHGPKAALAFTVQPSDTPAGLDISPAIVVEIRDAFGNVVTTAAADVTLEVTGGVPALGGTPTQAADMGVATFGDISIDVAGVDYTLDASVSGLPSVTSALFDIIHGPAAALAFVVQPTDTPAGLFITPAIVVEIQDAYGNVVATATDNVTLTETGGATLNGVTTKAAVAGVGTFDNISIDTVGVDYSLDATSGALPTATSALFDIQQVVGPVFVNELHYNNQGGDTNEGFEIAGPAGTDLTGWTVELYDGNKGTSYGTVTLSGTITDQQNGYGTLWFAQAGLENGSPDGLAVVNASSAVVQFVSYEGEFDAVDGPATGMRSVDIGVSETAQTPATDSLQLAGTGTTYEDFTWQAPAPNTAGLVNTGQTF